MNLSHIRRMRGVVTQHPLLVDAGLALVLAVPPIANRLLDPRHSLVHTSAALDGAAIALLLVAITVRRMWPLRVLIVSSLVIGGILIVTGAQHPLFGILIAIAAYTTASRLGRWDAWLAVGGCVLILCAIVLVRCTATWWAPENLGFVAWVGMATAFGDATRSRRDYIAEVEERARRAEQAREEEARHRVVEERVRIARELHDIVTHHIAVINVQAGAASHILRRRPDQVGPALAHIRNASDVVLRELASVVGLLRQSSDLVTVEPQPGMSRLDELLRTLAVAGLAVDYQSVGTARELPAGVDLAAYRILQEALTNAQKHGTGSARLTVTHTPDSVVLDITNTAARRSFSSTGGYGIIGMRERATAAGGTLDVGSAVGGRFTVRAVLPVPTPKAAP